MYIDSVHDMYIYLKIKKISLFLAIHTYSIFYIHMTFPPSLAQPPPAEGKVTDNTLTEFDIYGMWGDRRWGMKC